MVVERCISAEWACSSLCTKSTGRQAVVREFPRDPRRIFLLQRQRFVVSSRLMEEARPSDRELSIGQRESDLKVQFEQVHIALQQLRQTQESMHGLETRFADMTRDCAAILERWANGTTSSGAC